MFDSRYKRLATSLPVFGVQNKNLTNGKLQNLKLVFFHEIRVRIPHQIFYSRNPATQFILKVMRFKIRKVAIAAVNLDPASNWKHLVFKTSEQMSTIITASQFLIRENFFCHHIFKTWWILLMRFLFQKHRWASEKILFHLFFKVSPEILNRNKCKLPNLHLLRFEIKVNIPLRSF